MLARRFTFVCVLITLFGMWFSSLVASAERPQAQYRSVQTCVFDDTPTCRALRAYGNYH